MSRFSELRDIEETEKKTAGREYAPIIPRIIRVTEIDLWSNV